MSIQTIDYVEREIEFASNLDSPVGMVLIPAGSFLMGSEDGGEFERPVHEVYLDDFWMDETPVTNQQFAEFVQATGYETEAERAGGAWGYRDGHFSLIPNLSWKNYALPEREEHPVVLVSWNDAQAYVKWVGQRLPTEAEWEKAARGGLVGKLYPWGDEKPDGTQSNFAKSPSEIPPTTPVKQFSPNGYGLYDMVGNVWQWCADWYGENYYRESPLKNPKGPEGGLHCVRRGGSWNVIQPFRLRTANRGAMDPYSFVPNVGFRCAKSK
jgi:formylglycine-generating enzyme required for sulfatase activity